MNHHNIEPDDNEVPLDGSCRHSEEQLEWARQQFTEEDYLRRLQEIRAPGGIDFRDLMDELERSSA